VNLAADTNDVVMAGSRKMLGGTADLVSYGEEVVVGAVIGVEVGRVGDETQDNCDHLTQQPADARNSLELGIAIDIELCKL
jgi:hypothetical protein